MNYQIKIEFTSNIYRAGKLSLINSVGEVLLSKVPVAIPYGTGLMLEKSGLVAKKFTINKDYVNNEVFGDEYQSAFDKVINNGLSQVIADSRGIPVFASKINSYNDESFVGDTKLFILEENDFLRLLSVTEHSTNNISMSVEKVSFLWFPEKVVSYSDRSDSLSDLTKIETQIKNYKKIEEQKESTVEVVSDRRLVVEDRFLSKKKKIDTTKNDKLVDNFILEGNVKKVDTSKDKFNVKSNSKIGVNKVNYSRARDNNDELDAFDILFMYQYPELALLYRPNSLLAWSAYFGQQTHNINNAFLNYNINGISGFEDVASSDLKYNQNGYSVSLYGDADKKDLLGVLNFNSDNSEYKLSSPNGEVTYLKENENNIWTGYTTNDLGAEIKYEFGMTDTGYVGNWNATSKDGISINSGVNIDSSFNQYSSPNNEIDVVTFMEKETYQQNNYLYNAPPPPPPPPEAGQTWATSNDSYNSFGFGP
jgi:hypothetical protein